MGYIFYVSPCQERQHFEDIYCSHVFCLRHFTGTKKYHQHYYYYHFMAPWTLSGTTRVSQCQKVHLAIFWIFWCKMKITQADAPVIQMDCSSKRYHIAG